MSLDHALPGLYHAEDLPLRFTVYDDDAMGDELIGTADLNAGTGEVTLEIRSAGDVPVSMGSLRLRIEHVE